MKILRAAILGLCLLSASGCAALLKPQPEQTREALKGGDYRLDPDHASLIFKIDHLGFSKFVGRFEEFDAALTFDETDPTAAQVDAIIEVASLDIANDDFAKVLVGSRWFDADRFPQARFSVTSIEPHSDAEGAVTGLLTLKGVEAPVRLDVTFNGGGFDRLRQAYVVGFSAKGNISRKAFNIDRFSGLINDVVEIEIEAEFIRSGTESAIR